MKKTDIFVVGLMYAICLFFAVMTIKLPPNAQVYPFAIIVLLFLLNSLYVVQMFIAAKKVGVVKGLEEFKGFLPKQFFPIFAMTVAYIVLMSIIGFYISSVIYMVAVLLFLKVKNWQIALATVVIMLLVYGAFTAFLGVRLPSGIFFS